MDEIGELDRWTIRHVYLFPKDPKTGAIIRSSRPAAPTSERQTLATFFGQFGMPDWWVDAAIREAQTRKPKKSRRRLRLKASY